jgi:2-oxoglutarate dehydrogenase E1 component
MQDLSFLLNAHPSYVDQLYKNFMQDPNSVEAEWRNFFTGYDFAFNTSKVGVENNSTHLSINIKEFKVVKLIYAYRNKGHLVSDTNPIRPRKRQTCRFGFAFL